MAARGVFTEVHGEESCFIDCDAVLVMRRCSSFCRWSAALWCQKMVCRQIRIHTPKASHERIYCVQPIPMLLNRFCIAAGGALHPGVKEWHADRSGTHPRWRSDSCAHLCSCTARASAQYPQRLCRARSQGPHCAGEVPGSDESCKSAVPSVHMSIAGSSEHAKKEAVPSLSSYPGKPHHMQLKPLPWLINFVIFAALQLL